MLYVNIKTNGIVYLFSSGSTSVFGRQRASSLAAVPGHRARRHVHRDAARQLLPLHRHDVLMRENRC